MSQEDLCPILSLPDGLLCHIFSFIKDIPFKLKMESVCKRFQTISSTHSESWSGNDTLDINVNCSGPWDKSSPSLAVMKYKSGCSKIRGVYYPIYLNGLKIAFAKWPQAIAQFLQRAKVTNLSLHINVAGSIEDIESVWDSFTLVQNHPEIKFESIEYHCGSGSKSYLPSDELFLWALERSHKSITSIVLAIEERATKDMDELWPQICSSIEQCPKLKSFAFKPAALVLPFDRMAQALAGKPLTSLSIGGNIWIFESKDSGRKRRGSDSEDTNLHPTEQAVLAICKGSTAVPGIKSLRIASLAGSGPTFIPNLSKLDSRSKESLEEIVIAHGDSREAIANQYLRKLGRLPFVFPNLRLLYLDLHSDNGKLDEDLLLNTDFFNACNQTPNVDRKVVITRITVGDRQMFRGRLKGTCKEAEINVLFTKKRKTKIWGATLRKGHGTIELGQVKEAPSNYYSGMGGMSDIDEGFGMEMEMEDWGE